MTSRPDGKVALVTGASYGIGQATAVALARNGFDVVMAARGPEGGNFGAEYLDRGMEKIQATGHRAVFHATDIFNPSSIQRLYDLVMREFGRLDVLINAASALPEEADFESLDEETIQSLINTLQGTLLVTKVFLPLLRESEGHLLFISSDWALRGSGGPPVFSAIKAGIAAFARGLSRRVLRQGVKVTVIYPGDVASYDPSWSEPKYDIDTPDEVLEQEFLAFAREEGLDVVPLRVHLREIAEEVVHAVTRRTSRLEEIAVSPTYATYDSTELVEL